MQSPSIETATPPDPERGGAPPARSKQVTQRETAMLVMLVSIYVVVIVTLALMGRYMFIFKTAIIPVIVLIALLMGRITVFVNDWLVFIASVVLFDCCRGLVFALTLRYDLPIHALYAARWDEALLGGESLPVLLQRLIFKPPVIGPFEKFLTVIHGSHFALFLFVGVAVWLFRRDQFFRFRRAVILLMVLGITFYFLVPTVPPWMASNLHIISPIRHITNEIYNAAVPTLQATFDTNPIAAMPSLHTAFPTLCSLIALHHFGRRAIVMPIYTVFMWFSIAYLGEHYIVDIFAGILLAAFVFWVSYRSAWFRGTWNVGEHVTEAPAPARATWVRQAVIALGLVAVSEGIGQLTLNTRHDLVFNPSFVAHDMVGRSDKTHLVLGHYYATAKKDYVTARREFTLALTELRDPKDRAHARELMDQLPPVTATPAPTSPGP